MAVEFEAVCEPKFMTFWDDVGDPFSCQCTCPIVYIVFHRCEVVHKGWFLAPDL